MQYNYSCKKNSPTVHVNGESIFVLNQRQLSLYTAIEQLQDANDLSHKLERECDSGHNYSNVNVST